jgi:hypothetical protein
MGTGHARSARLQQRRRRRRRRVPDFRHLSVSRYFQLLGALRTMPGFQQAADDQALAFLCLGILWLRRRHHDPSGVITRADLPLVWPGQRFPLKIAERLVELKMLERVDSRSYRIAPAVLAQLAGAGEGVYTDPRRLQRSSEATA